jgi:hypothetical protein
MLQSQRSRRAKKLRNRPEDETVISICTDLFYSLFAKKSSGCFSLPVHYLPPAAAMTAPMLPMSVHIITAGIEEEEEGGKASPIHRRRRPLFDQPANRTKIPIRNATIAIRLA